MRERERQTERRRQGDGDDREGSLGKRVRSEVEVLGKARPGKRWKKRKSLTFLSESGVGILGWKCIVLRMPLSQHLGGRSK